MLRIALCVKYSVYYQHDVLLYIDIFGSVSLSCFHRNVSVDIFSGLPHIITDYFKPVSSFLFLPLITITSNLAQSDCYINDFFQKKKGAIILTSTVKNGRHINLYIGLSIKDEYLCENGLRSKFCICLLFTMCDRRTHIYLPYERSLEYIVGCISSIKE